MAGLVLGIIGMVLGVIVPLIVGLSVHTWVSYSASRFVHRGEESKITAAQVKINDLETALDAFDTDCGRYPTEQEGLNALAVQPGNAANWHCYYPKGIPNDPWGRPYIYRYPGQKNPNLFDLYSCGPSGVDGGSDNIGNWQKKQ